MIDNITVKETERLLADTIMELKEEPEFQRGDRATEYAVDKNSVPLVKVAIGNVPIDYDLWEGLRNPAMVGIYPAGLPEIWEYYANRRKQKVDESGRNTMFQVPRPFDYALKNYRRAVVISAMLPFSQKIIHDYVSEIAENKKGSSYLFRNMYERVNKILDKSISRAAISLFTGDSDRVVVVMNTETVKAVSTEAIPQTRQGTSHGPSKGGNYSQKSIAALVGLGQFGVSRIIFRDEIVNNKVERFMGPIRSIIIFDKQAVVNDCNGGVMFPTPEWRRFLLSLFDFTNTEKNTNQYRFCTHIPLADKGCNKCADCCPSGAQMNSMPDFAGKYNERVSKQPNRFWDGKLQFDANRCTDERGQISGLLPEWSCARCVTFCMDHGMKRKQAARNYYQKLAELTKKAEAKV